MPTDGADFKRRMKYHGRTYTEIKTGADVKTVASFGCAGLAREILGDNPIPAYRDLINATTDCLQGLFSSDRSYLLQDLQNRLTEISSRQATSVAQQMVVESLIREAGRISSLPTQPGTNEITERLFVASGNYLHEGLVIEKTEHYVLHHRCANLEELGDFLGSWRDEAAARSTEMMRSIFENGKPDRQFRSPRPELTPLRADSMEDLTASLT